MLLLPISLTSIKFMANIYGKIAQIEPHSLNDIKRIDTVTYDLE